MYRKTSHIAGWFLVALLSCAVASATDGRRPIKRHDIVGTWTLARQIEGLDVPVLVKITFSADGTVVASSASDNDGFILAGGRSTAFHGNWRRIGRRSFEYSIERFQILNATLLGSFRVNERVRLSRDGRTLRGELQTEVIPLGGSAIATQGGTSTGERMPIGKLSP